MALDSTDAFRESDPYRPRTPYNASKAGADHAVRAYIETYRAPGHDHQLLQQLRALSVPREGDRPLHDTSDRRRPATSLRSTQNKREWLHVDDHCSAIDLVLERGGSVRPTTSEAAKKRRSSRSQTQCCETLGKPQSLKSIVEDRPGHDRRYLLDSSKIAQRARLGAQGARSRLAWLEPWSGTRRTGAGGSRSWTVHLSSKALGQGGLRARAEGLSRWPLEGSS